MKLTHRAPVGAYWLGSLTLTALASIQVVRDEAAGRTSLDILTSAIHLLAKLGKHLAAESRIIILMLIAALGAILLAAAAYTRQRGGRPSVPLLAGGVAIALLAQGCFVASLVPAAIGGYVVSVCLFVLYARSEVLSSEPAQDQASFDWRDCGVLFALTAIALLFRMYALNRILNFFEGEMSPYMAGATSFRGIFVANIGLDGPWAPAGYFFYLPIYAATKSFGISPLSVRLASAWVSILSVPLMYFVVRAFANRVGAIVATACIVLDPLQVGWGRSDIYPHGSTVWSSFLIAWALLRLFQTGARCYLWGCVLLMGLTFHQYPSGQFAVLMPFLVLAWYLIRERAVARRVGWYSILFLIGLALWAVGWPLEYYLALGEWRLPNALTAFGERTAWAQSHGQSLISVMAATCAQVVQNGYDYILGLYLRVPHLFPYDLVPELPAVPPRTATWFVATLAAAGAVIGLVSRRRWTWIILLAWIAAGLVPMVFSNVAYPKRGSATYPAVMALAGVTAALLLGELRRSIGRVAPMVAAAIGAAVFAGYMAIASYQWFSGERYPAGRPTALALAEAAGQHVTPGTILIIDGYDHPMTGRLSFLLLAYLLDPARQPSVATHLSLIQRPFSEIVRNPASVIARVGHTYPYRWTDLWKTWPQLKTYRDWHTVVFAFETSSVGDEHQPMVAHFREALARCPDAVRSAFYAAEPMYRYDFVSCPLASLQNPPPLPTPDATPTGPRSKSSARRLNIR